MLTDRYVLSGLNSAKAQIFYAIFANCDSILSFICGQFLEKHVFKAARLEKLQIPNCELCNRDIGITFKMVVYTNITTIYVNPVKNFQSVTSVFSST